MKKILLALFFLCSIAVEAETKEIIAEVVFENATDVTFSSGTFFITELEEEIEITSLENFKITLPKKGKYQFGFYAEEFVSYILYPSKITSRKNIIRIRLESKIKSNAVSGFTIYTNNPDIGMNFVYNGINNKPIDFTRFTEEYGVGMISKNCVVDPLMMKYVTAHNQKVAAYLTAKFGVTWKDDLPATPFGLQKQ